MTGWRGPGAAGGRAAGWSAGAGRVLGLYRTGLRSETLKGLRTEERNIEMFLQGNIGTDLPERFNVGEVITENRIKIG